MRFIIPLTVQIALLALVHFQDVVAGEVLQQNQVEAARRQDPTGSGTFHRSGMLREQEAARTRSAHSATAVAKPITAPETPKKKKFFLWRWLFGE